MQHQLINHVAGLEYTKLHIIRFPKIVIVYIRKNKYYDFQKGAFPCYNISYNISHTGHYGT